MTLPSLLTDKVLNGRAWTRFLKRPMLTTHLTITSQDPQPVIRHFLTIDFTHTTTTVPVEAMLGAAIVATHQEPHLAFGPTTTNQKPNACTAAQQVTVCATAPQQLQTILNAQLLLNGRTNALSLSRSGKEICLWYNVKGTCTDSCQHGEHSCSLCGESHHGVAQCMHN